MQLQFLDVSALVGHLHPVLVHLPIGILLIGLFLEWLASRNKDPHLAAALPPVLFTGALTAICSCISGYVLSLTESYDPSTLDLHKWMGISVALVSSFAYATLKGYLPFSHRLIIYRGSCILLFALIIITGHLGGSLTHGSGYITQYLPPPLNKLSGAAEDTPYQRPVIQNVQEAFLYKDLVAPVLYTRCRNCHGPSRQKGGLRLDEQKWILKGGKDGEILNLENPEKSEMIRRLLLPADDDDHMPPKEKKQLTREEIQLLHWWALNGADFKNQVNAFSQSDSIRNILTRFQNQEPEIVLGINPEIPDSPAVEADLKIVDSLRRKKVLVMPVSVGSNYLQVNFINAPEQADSLAPLLQALGKQILYLKLGGSWISDTGAVFLGQLDKLVRLHLDHTNISDTGIVYLNSLKNLWYLNLAGTRVSIAGLGKLDSLKNLKSLYLFQTKISSRDWPLLKEIFPATVIDTGGYAVPTLATDTTVVSPPEKKKKKK